MLLFVFFNFRVEGSEGVEESLRDHGISELVEPQIELFAPEHAYFDGLGRSQILEVDSGFLPFLLDKLVFTLRSGS